MFVNQLYHSYLSIDPSKYIDKYKGLVSANPKHKFQDELLTYFEAIGFKAGESLVIRASNNKKQLIYFGKIRESDIELWETRCTGKDKDGISQYEVNTQVLNPIAHLLELGLHGYGIFSYPNHVAGGMGNKHAQAFTTLFYEDDWRSLDEQWERLSILRNLGVEPTIVVYSGSKSYHTYIALTESIKSNCWQRLNRMLSIVMDSDIAVNTLARAMRLPGVPRVKDAEIKEVKIVHLCDHRYDPDFIENALLSTGLFPYGLSESRWQKYQSILKKEGREKALHWLTVAEDELNPKPTYHAYDNFTSGSGQYIPLNVVLSKANRDYLKGVANNRNQTGTGLAKDLHGSYQKLIENSFKTDDPYNLFLEYCQNCSQGNGWNQKEWESVWKSATRGNPNPSLPDEAFWNCVNAHLVKTGQIERLKSKRKNYAFDNLSTQKTKDDDIKSESFKGIKREKGAIEISGDRAHFIQSLVDARKNFLDVTFVGLGKSHTLQFIENPDGKIFILCADPRNPSVEAIAQKYTRLDPRNKYGFYRDTDGKLKKADKDTPLDKIEIQGNCAYAPLFPYLQEKGYDTSSGDNPICNKCEYKKECQLKDGFYFNDRRKALESQYIICHPETLAKTNIITSNDLVFVDEPSMILNPTKEITTTRNELILEVDNYRGKIDDEFYQIIDKITQTLKPLFDDKSKYGLDNEKVMATLSAVNIPKHFSIDNIISFLTLNQPDIGELIVEADRVNEKKKNKSLTDYFIEKQIEEAVKNIDRLPSNTLPSILKAIGGSKEVYLRIQHGKLIITVNRVAEYSYLNESKCTGFLETTTTSDKLRLRSGFNKPLEVIYSPDVNHNNQTIYAIKKDGIKSVDLTDKAVGGIKLLTETLFERYGKFQLLGHKKLKKPVTGQNARNLTIDLDGHYGADNVGSNRFKGQEFLGFIQLPYANKGALMAEFSVLHNEFDKVAFEKYWEADMREKLVQGVIGRQRAVRDSQKIFSTFLIHDDSYDSSWLKNWGVSVVSLDAFDINPLAGDENQVTFYRILEAWWHGRKNSIKPTEAAIAKIMTTNGHKITADGVAKAVKRAGYSFKEFTTKFGKLDSAYILTNRSSLEMDFGCIFPNLYRDWITADTFSTTDSAKVVSPKITTLDLIKEAILPMHRQGIKVTQKAVSDWLTTQGNPRTQQAIAKCLKAHGIKLTDLLPVQIPIVEVFSLEDDIEAAIASVDLPDSKETLILDGQNEIVDITTDSTPTPLESNPKLEVGDRVFNNDFGYGAIRSVSPDEISVGWDVGNNESCVHPLSLRIVKVENWDDVIAQIKAYRTAINWSKQEVKNYWINIYKVDSIKKLTDEQILKFRDYLVMEVNKRGKIVNVNLLIA